MHRYVPINYICGRYSSWSIKFLPMFIIEYLVVIPSATSLYILQTNSFSYDYSFPEKSTDHGKV